MKKAVENKVKKPVANKETPSSTPPLIEEHDQERGEGKVLIEILPGRGIGGIGGPGTQTWMDRATAEQYVADGYVRILQEQPVIVVGSSLDKK